MSASKRLKALSRFRTDTPRLDGIPRNAVTTCSFYEVVSINGEDIAFPNMKCGASASLDGPELTLKDMANCDVCGMGALINGTFNRFAEIIFDYGDGKLVVKQVNKLI